MSLYLDPTGLSSYSIQICARCKMKMFTVDAVSDPNAPGIWGHRECIDLFDPWRLPARQPEDIVVLHPLPDAPLATTVENPA